MKDNGLPTYSELEQEIERQRRIIDGGIDAASAHGAERQSLRRRIELQDATINRQAAQLIELQAQLDTERMKAASLRANVAQLRAALDAVPLQPIFHFVHGTMYDPRANVDDYMPDDYDADRAAIDAWLRKELSAE